jgi:hypothetical protein
VLVRFGLRLRSRSWVTHWAVPVCGIGVVLLVFSGMSALAIEVGAIWLLAGLVYGAMLMVRNRRELQQSTA